MNGSETNWSLIAPLAAPQDVRIDTDRSDEQDRALLRQLVHHTDWPSLGWPELADALVSLGRTDIAFGRLAEGHIDAMRIINQGGGRPTADCLYGVWASRSRGAGLTLAREADHLVLSGTLPFASGAGMLDRALITAIITNNSPSAHHASGEDPSLDDSVEHQLLLDVDVHDWAPDAGSWRTSAMAASRSFTVQVEHRPVPTSSQIGEPDFYLDRPGFFPGGVGVAAVWVGGAARVADLLREFLMVRGRDLDQLTRVHLGGIRQELVTAGAILAQGIHLLTGADLSQWSATERQDSTTEVRAGIGRAVRRLLDRVRELAGPAGLAHYPGLADAVADLDLYVRQQHSDRDAEQLAGRWPST